MNLDKIKDLLNVDEVLSIVKLCHYYSKEEREISFIWNDKKYKIEKCDNSSIILECSDGRSLVLDYRGNLNDEFKWINGAYDFLKEYPNTQLNFSNPNVTILPSDSTDEIKNKFVISFYVESPDYMNFTFDSSLDKINVNGNETSNVNGEMEFSEEGIKYHNYLIANDGKSIISFKEDRVPTVEELKIFNIKKEREIFLNVVKNTELKCFTKEALLSLFTDENSPIVDGADDLYDFYTYYLPQIGKFIKFRNSIIDGSIEKLLFSKAELKEFFRVLYSQLVDNKKEENEKTL